MHVILTTDAEVGTDPNLVKLFPATLQSYFTQTGNEDISTRSLPTLIAPLYPYQSVLGHMNKAELVLVHIGSKPL